MAALTDQQTLALTMWAEARQIPRSDPRDHSPVEELLAVGCVVRNRLPHPERWRATDASYKAICLAPRQFSCWNDGTDANHVALLDQARLLVDPFAAPVLLRSPDPEVRECLHLASGIITGVIIDRTNGATSYWAPAMVPPGRIPEWAVGKPILQIGDQNFLS